MRRRIMTRMLTCICLLASLGAAGVRAAGQAPPPQPPAQPPAQSPPPAAPPAAAAPAGQAPAAPVAFSYNPEGRRDPFVSLANRGSDGRSVANRPTGLPGVLIDEVTVKGILKDQTGLMALIQGGDSRIYRVRPGDRLMDGTVKAITADAVVFSQDVNDPLVLQKQREIRKSLRPGEESRG
jgi:Tfp pilus assembly protein PilP